MKEGRKEILLDLRDILKKLEKESETLRFALLEGLLRYAEAGFNGTSSVPYFEEIIQATKRLSSHIGEERYILGVTIKEIVTQLLCGPYKAASS